jgi:hypothetical protein
MGRREERTQNDRTGTVLNALPVEQRKVLLNPTNRDDDTLTMQIVDFFSVCVSVLIFELICQLCLCIYVYV